MPWETEFIEKLVLVGCFENYDFKKNE